MQKIRKDLFPDVIYEGTIYTSGDVSPLVQIVKQEGYRGKIVVSGEGSIGKSTMLTDLRLSMLREERAFVYFNLRDLMDARDVEALADRVNGYKGDGLIVILDSYDETSMAVDNPENSARAKAERLIDDFATRNNVALLIVGARLGCKSANTTIEFDAWARDRGFKTATLQRLSDEKLDSILSDRKNISPELRKLLKNTMFLSMYLEAPETDWESAANEAKFIDKYFDEVFCAKLERQSPEYRGIIKEKLFSIINKIGESLWNGFCGNPRKRVEFENSLELNTIFKQKQYGNDWEVHATQEKYLSYCVAKYLSQKGGEGILNIFNDRSGSDFLPEDLERTINEGLYYTGQLLSDSIVNYLNDVLHKTSNSNIFCWLSQIILGHNKGEIRYGETIIEELPTKVFKRNIYLKSIELPVNIKNIEAGSFIGCTSLEQINISKKNHKYKCIDGNLYSKYGRNLIQYAIGKTEDSFEVPLSVEIIRDEAFCGSKSLKRIVVPKSVTYIGEHAFDECGSLCQITVDENSEYYKSIDGNLYDKMGTELIRYAMGKSKDIFILYPRVETIAEFAFHDCQLLKKIVILKGTETIEEYAFSGCQSLKNIVIPSSVTYIGEHAFDECGSLCQINVDENSEYYKSIDGNLYDKSASNLIQYARGKTEETFEIPTCVETIGRNALYGSLSLKGVTIPSSVKFIKMGAFADCKSLESVEILDGVKDIQYFAFSGCQSLKNISIPSSVKKIGIWAFDYCRLLESVAISDGVEVIEEFAFRGCQALKKITIPHSIEKIGKAAFSGCKSLSTVYYGGTEKEWKRKGFDKSKELAAAEKYYYSEQEPEAEGNYWHYGEDGEPTIWKK